MFLKRKMNDSTNSYSDKILQIKEKIGEADAVVIGAGAGFSTGDTGADIFISTVIWMLPDRYIRTCMIW